MYQCQRYGLSNHKASFWKVECIIECKLILAFYIYQDRFVEQIEKAAEPPKHPVKDGGQGLKAFLIRRLGAYMKSTYGSHLPDLVGATVASIFDFDEPLTRDDVRPYLKPTGKKSLLPKKTSCVCKGKFLPNNCFIYPFKHSF